MDVVTLFLNKTIWDWRKPMGLASMLKRRYICTLPSLETQHVVVHAPVFWFYPCLHPTGLCAAVSGVSQSWLTDPPCDKLEGREDRLQRHKINTPHDRLFCLCFPKLLQFNPVICIYLFFIWAICEIKARFSLALFIVDHFSHPLSVYTQLPQSLALSRQPRNWEVLISSWGGGLLKHAALTSHVALEVPWGLQIREV